MLTNTKTIRRIERAVGRRAGAMMVAAAAGAVGLLAGVASGQDLTKRPGPQTVPVLITNATVHPISGTAIKDGYVYMVNGRIEAVGAAPPPKVAAPVTVIDAKGQGVYPGLIAPFTRLGLDEIGSVRASRDFNEAGDVTPEVRAAVAVNPDSWLHPVTRINGVLAAAVFPSGGVLPGRASVIRLEGWTWEDMTVRDDAGQVVQWPFMRAVNAWWMDRSEEDQRRDIRRNTERVEESFKLAKAYLLSRDAGRGPAGAAGGGGTGGGGSGGGGGIVPPLDLRWEAMRSIFGPPINGGVQRPVFLEAQDYDQIVSAVDFALKNGLKPVIVGGRDAPLCAELLKKHDVPVIVTGTIVMPKRDDTPVDDPFTLPGRLHAAGVRFTISSGEETPHERNLPYAAALAVAYGLDRDVALRSLTLGAAEILGVGEVLGSIEPGKEATLIIADGHPLEVATTVTGAYIQGKAIDLSNKQTVLAEKYREKYKQEREKKQREAGAGAAPGRAAGGGR